MQREGWEKCVKGKDLEKVGEFCYLKSKLKTNSTIREEKGNRIWKSNSFLIWLKKYYGIGILKRNKDNFFSIHKVWKIDVQHVLSTNSMYGVDTWHGKKVI